MKNKVLQIRVDEQWLKAIDAIIKKTHLKNRSQLIRRSIDKYLNDVMDEWDTQLKIQYEKAKMDNSK